MLIHGKERKFLFSVGASANIAKMCPGKDFSKMSEVLANPDWSVKVGFLTNMAHELNKAYEVALKYEDGDHIVDIITVEELATLDFKQFKELQEEIEKTCFDGLRTEVEVEPSKKKDNLG